MQRLTSLKHRLRLLCLVALLPAMLPLAATNSSASASLSAQIDALPALTEIAQATPPARLVKDIFPGQVMKYDSLAEPRQLTAVGPWLYFVAGDLAVGVELWRTDGTLTNTTLVADLCPGTCSANLQQLTLLGSTLFFTANDPASGNELWKTDGTPQGTVIVKDIQVGDTGSEPQSLQIKGDQLFFTADDGTHGRELWRSDGTAAGTQLVADINTGAAPAGPAQLTLVGNTLFFTATTAIVGGELWRSDGTAAGTVLVKDIAAGASNANPTNLTAIGAMLYFGADDGTHGRELWRSDGSAANTQLVKDIYTNGSSYPDFMHNLQGKLIFKADDGVHSHELWRSDGTAAGTVLVKDIFPGPIALEFGEGLVVGNQLLFAAADDMHFLELWRSDGTTAGTTMVKDIEPMSSSYPNNLTLYQGMAYFSAYDSTHGYELWRSDGTAAGTVLVKDIIPGTKGTMPSEVTVFQQSLIFYAKDPDSDMALWKSDGTAAGTAAFLNVGSEAASSADPRSFYIYRNDSSFLRSVAFLDQLFFFAHDGIHNWGLWKSDGTQIGTHLVRGFPRSPPVSQPPWLTVSNGWLFFSAGDSRGRELWRSHGSSIDTTIVADLTNIPNEWLGDYIDTAPQHLTSINNILYFSSNVSPNGSIWRSDGTEAGTISLGGSGIAYQFLLLNGIVVAIGDGRVIRLGTTPEQTQKLASLHAGGDFAQANKTLFFVGADHLTNCSQCGVPINYELWKTDGTVAGTGKVREIIPGTENGSGPSQLTAIGNRVFFTVDDGTHGEELWVSDGTTAGTTLVKDIAPNRSSAPAGLLAVGQTLYFSADDGTHGRELWRSDGTAAGTTLVKDINPTMSSELTTLRAHGNLLLFTANDGAHGRELWRSDGTPAGTALVADIEPGPRSSTIGEFQPLGSSGDLLVAAGGQSTGVELWQTNGVQARQVQEIDPGPNSSNPQSFTAVGSQIFFRADTLGYGRELWVIDTTSLNLSPSAANSTLFVRPEQTIAAGLPGSDANGGSLQFTITNNAQKGAVTLVNAATGSFRYQPQPNAAGSDTFSYRVSDGTFTSRVGTITIVISQRASTGYLPLSKR